MNNRAYKFDASPSKVSKATQNIKFDCLLSFTLFIRNVKFTALIALCLCYLIIMILF